MRRQVATVAGLLVLWGMWTYFFPATPKLVPLTRMTPPPGPTVILAPHSDDELLAAGGLMQELAAQGAPPWVVLATSGDSFKVAAEANFRRMRITPERMQEFGQIRLAESRKALQVLGIPQEQLLFLGFPDRSLNRLWMECWEDEEPCTSPSTGVNRVPYREAQYPGAPYTGEELVRELKAILLSIRPALVVYPHPNEAHVDHWALSNFVTAALEELRREDASWHPPVEWLYLVHRGDWPAPKGYRPYGELLPPVLLTGGMTLWREEPLSTDQVKRKEQALKAYPSQLRVLRRYMESFIRTNELFGTIDRAHLLPPGSTGLAARGVTAPPWADYAWVRVLTDPQADTVAREVERGADLQSIWAATDGKMLYLAAQMASRPFRPVEVRFYLRGYKTGVGWTETLGVRVRPDGSHTVERGASGTTPTLVQSSVQGAWLRLAVPLADLRQSDSIMLNAETWINDLLIDRSAWRPVSRDGR